MAFPWHGTSRGELLGEAAFRVQIPRSFLRGPLGEVLVAFIVAMTEGKRSLVWGGAGCNALCNTYALLFLFLCLLQGDPA